MQGFEFLVIKLQINERTQNWSSSNERVTHLSFIVLRPMGTSETLIPSDSATKNLDNTLKAKGPLAFSGKLAIIFLLTSEETRKCHLIPVSV